MKTDTDSDLFIGWASRDITPERPAMLRGLFHVRVSEGVMDPITVTALALESVSPGKTAGQAVLVSCDMVAIPNGLRDAACERLKRSLPELNTRNICIHATHTHTAPGAAPSPAAGGVPDSFPEGGGLAAHELGAMEPSENVTFVADRIAEVVREAWQNRAPGGIGFGLGQAVIGHNRRISYFNGETHMYGNTKNPEFSHAEGGTDHAVNLMCTWNKQKKMTGMVVNLACPSQVSELQFQISADYWHETRLELRNRFGENLFVLPQCSAAGDQSPHVQIDKPAEARMLKLAGRTQRQDIAVRIADAVTAILPFVEKAIDWHPTFVHKVETLELPLRQLNEQDVKEAIAESEANRLRHADLLQQLEAHPEKRKEPRWYQDVTACYRRMTWNRSVATRYALQSTQPLMPFDIHILRLGEIVFATSPFEMYLDFGLQIKSRSKAAQTFVVQLAGAGSYLPTLRATMGKSYGALPASTPIGPDGGRLLVNQTLEIIEAAFMNTP